MLYFFFCEFQVSHGGYKIAFCGCDTSVHTLESIVANHHNVSHVFTWPVDGQYVKNSKLIELSKSIRAKTFLSPISGFIEDVWKECDVIISHIYPFKLPVPLTPIPFSINIHPSPLPIGKGRWPLPYALLAEFSEFGVAAHKHSDEWDSGDLLGVKNFPMNSDDCMETLMAKSSLASSELIIEILDDLPERWGAAQSQGHNSYWNYPNPELRTIDWSLEGEVILKISRAFGFFTSYAAIEKQLYRIRDAKFFPWQHSLKPGSTKELVPGAICVAVIDGFIVIRDYEMVNELPGFQ